MEILRHHANHHRNPVAPQVLEGKARHLVKAFVML
jgi:hypothetical protein